MVFFSDKTRYQNGGELGLRATWGQVGLVARESEDAPDGSGSPWIVVRVERAVGYFSGLGRSDPMDCQLARRFYESIWMMGL